MNAEARMHEENQNRLRALELGQQRLFDQQAHLDECVDSVKDKVQGAIKKIDNWDRRFIFLVALALGTQIASGTGTISLQHLLEILKAVK